MRKSLLSALALCIAAAPFILSASQAAATSATPDSGAVQDGLRQDDDSPLGRAMGTLNRGQKNLRKLIADPAANRAELLQMLGDMEAATLVAYANLPAAREGMSEADMAVWHVEYKETILGLTGKLLAMHKAALRGETETLATLYGELGPIKKQGHDSFK